MALVMDLTMSALLMSFSALTSTGRIEPLPLSFELRFATGAIANQFDDALEALGVTLA